MPDDNTDPLELIVQATSEVERLRAAGALGDKIEVRCPQCEWHAWSYTKFQTDGRTPEELSAWLLAQHECETSPEPEPEPEQQPPNTPKLMFSDRLREPFLNALGDVSKQDRQRFPSIYARMDEIKRNPDRQPQNALDYDQLFETIEKFTRACKICGKDFFNAIKPEYECCGSECAGISRRNLMIKRQNRLKG